MPRKNDHRRRSPSEPFQFSLRSLILVPAAIVVFCFVYGSATRGCVSGKSFDRIDYGMTEAEVLQILGPPVRKHEDGSEWEYSTGFLCSEFIVFEGQPPVVETIWAL